MSPVWVHPAPGWGANWPSGRQCRRVSNEWVGPGTGLEDRAGAVGLRARFRSSTAPASWRSPNAARPRRCPRSRPSAWTAAACRRCGRWARVEPGPPSTKLEGRVPPRPLARVEPSPPPNRNHRPGGVTRPSKGMLSPRVEAGALGAGAVGGPLQAGKRWPGGVVHLQEHQQRRNDPSAQPCKNGPGRGAVDTSLEGACGCNPADRPVLGSGHGGSSVGFGYLLAQPAPAAAAPVQPPRQGVQKLKCSGRGLWTV